MDIPSRFDGLANICIDKTSMKIATSNMTVVINHDIRSAVWCAKRDVKEVISRTNASSKVTNNKIKLIVRSATDYWNDDNLLAMSMLSPSRHSALPCRAGELPTQTTDASYICFKAEKYKKTDEFTK